MTDEAKPENVTDIVLTWSGEKFVKRPISWSNFPKTDILAARANVEKNIYYKKCDSDIYMFPMHDKGGAKINGVVPVLRDLEWTCTFGMFPKLHETSACTACCMS